MANNFTPVGSEIQVNINGPANNFITNDQLNPDVAALSDGRFFVVYTHQFSVLDLDIIGQFVNPDGTTFGNPVEIQFVAGTQHEGAVAQRSGGAAVVVWDDAVASDEIHYSIISSAGGIGAETTILNGTPLEDPDVATLADGRSLVVARQENADRDIVFRFIDAAGNPTGVLDFVDNGAGDQVAPMVAAFGNNALVVYEDRTGGDPDIEARFYDGTSFATEVTIADGVEGSFDADVAALTDGRFIVVWGDDATDDIQARFVSAAGVPLGTAFAISNGGGFDFFARVAGLPDGGFIVTWGNEGASVGSEVDVDSDAVLARRFNSTGAPAGDLFLVNTGDPDTDQRDPAVAVNTTTGQAFITWEDRRAFAGADNDPDGIRGHGFLATTDIVNGAAGDDIITTYGLSETINGLGGDDLINGLGGNDIVHGGTGFDDLKGGLGDDQLFGEGGEDLLKGDDGNDLLVGGLGRDVQLGGAGKDTFDFNAIAESRFGANHDLIKGFKHSEHDKIDLKTVDADTTAGGNQAFDLIGAAGFSGTAGQLRFAVGLLQGDVNGDAIADLEVKVTGLGAAANGDFVL